MDEIDYFRAALKHFLKDMRGGQSNLALDSGLSEGYISQLVTGSRSNPSRKTLKNIALALKTTYLDMIALGKSIHEKDSFEHIHVLQKNYTVATPAGDDKYRIIAEVGEIIDSGNVEIIDALVKNVREFRRALDTSKRLNVCLMELKEVREDVSILRKQVDKLTAPPISADASAASSGKGET